MRPLLVSAQILLILSAQTAQAQDDALRKADFINTMMNGDAHVVVAANRTRRDCVLKWSLGIGTPSVELTLPFQRPGAFSDTMGGLLSEILISGWRLDNKGVICRLSFDPSRMAVHILETREYKGIDPIRLAYTGTRLFIMDGEGEKILTTPLAEDSPLPSPQDCEVAVAFAGSASSRLGSMVDESGQIMPNICAIQSVFDLVGPINLAKGANGRWMVFDPNALGKKVYIGRYHMTNSSRVSSTGPVLLWGKTGDYVVKNLESGRNVASGVIMNSKVVVACIPSRPMAVGAPHAVMSSRGEDRSNTFYPSVRHGAPMRFPTAAFDEGELFGGRIVVGGSEFTTSAWIGFDDLTTGPLELPVTVWWNWRDEVTGRDPIIAVGQSARLIGAVGSRDMTLSVGKNSLGQEMGLELPIANDRTLVGRVLFFQWATLTPDTHRLVLSDVYGSEIKAASSVVALAGSSPRHETSSSFAEISRAVSRTLHTHGHDLLRAKIAVSASGGF